MTASRFVAALLVGGALLSFAPAAWAEPTDIEKAHARDLMAEGREKRDKNDLPAAIEAFKQADAIMHVPTTGFEVAKTQQQLGKLIEARETVDAILKLPVTPSDPPPFAEARAKAEALAKDLDKAIPQVKFAFKAGRPSTVTIDDAPVANIDGPTKVNPGKHVIIARGDDGEARADITLAPSDSKEIELTLAKGSSVTVAPHEGTESPSKLKIPMLSWVGFGVGAAGLVVGSITGIMAFSAESDLDGKCKDHKHCPTSNQDALDSAKTKATISTVGFIVAGVGIAVGVVGLFVQPKTEAKVGGVTIDYTRLRATF